MFGLLSAEGGGGSVTREGSKHCRTARDRGTADALVRQSQSGRGAIPCCPVRTSVRTRNGPIVPGRRKWTSQDSTCRNSVCSASPTDSVAAASKTTWIGPRCSDAEVEALASFRGGSRQPSMSRLAPNTTCKGGRSTASGMPGGRSMGRKPGEHHPDSHRFPW